MGLDIALYITYVDENRWLCAVFPLLLLLLRPPLRPPLLIFPVYMYTSCFRGRL